MRRVTSRVSFLPVYTVKRRIPETVIIVVFFTDSGVFLFFYQYYFYVEPTQTPELVIILFFFTDSGVCVQFVLERPPIFPGNGNLITVSGVRGFTVQTGKNNARPIHDCTTSYY